MLFPSSVKILSASLSLPLKTVGGHLRTLITYFHRWKGVGLFQDVPEKGHEDRSPGAGFVDWITIIIKVFIKQSKQQTCLGTMI